ncbi:hypothetical protein Tco_1391663 [Tanacetum coccineum]
MPANRRTRAIGLSLLVRPENTPGPYTTMVTFVYWSFIDEKQKLTGPNFIDWYRQLRLVLSTEDKEYYLEHPIPAAPVAQPGEQIPPEDLAAHAAWVKGQKEVAVLMLLTMDLDIQRNLAHLGAYDMLQELKAMFSKQAEQELLQTVREFHTCKQEEGQSVSTHVLKMKGYIDNLERLGQPVGKNLAVSLILVSLNKDFTSFVQNFNMHGMGKTVNELHAMLKLHEESLEEKMLILHFMQYERDAVQKKQKEKNAQSWNCPVYLTELMEKRKLPLGAALQQENALKSWQHDGTSHSIDIESLGKWFHACLVRWPLKEKTIHIKWKGQRSTWTDVTPLSLCYVYLAKNIIDKCLKPLRGLKASGSVDRSEEIPEEDTNPSVELA